MSKLHLGTDLEYLPACVLEVEHDPQGVIAQLEEMYSVLGTKDKPLSQDGYQFHPDNIFLEFAIPATTSTAEFVDRVMQGKQRLSEITGQQLISGSVYSARLLRDAINAFSPSLKEQFDTFGCAPDFDAYTRTRRNVPGYVSKCPYREMGGHLHMDVKDPMFYPYFVLQVDEAFADWRKEAVMVGPDERAPYRPWYRQAGVYRDKPYGVEYRSLGSSWSDTEDSITQIADLSFQLMQEAA